MISTSNKQDDNSTIINLAQKKFPIVTVERYGEELKEVPRILVANREAEYMVVHRLVELGHKKIAFICGPEKADNARRRWEGYCQGLESLGIPYDENLVYWGDYKLDSGYKAAKKFLKESEFTAIIASNDMMAIGACKAIREEGKEVPDDISVIGYDGTLLAELFQPVLGTVVLNGYKIGQTSAETLLKVIKGKEIVDKKILFEPTIKLGESIKAIN